MAFADDLFPVIDSIRAIPGQLGLRKNRVYIIDGSWTGDRTGERSESQIATELTVGDNQPPKVRQLTDEQITLGNLPQGSIEVGPLTPEYSSGGLDLEALGANIATGDTMTLRVVGPAGTVHYVITSIRSDRALRRVIQARPVGSEPA